MSTKLVAGQWYWINDPGSNMHPKYQGPAKCLSTEVNNTFCGGPAYLFEVPVSPVDPNSESWESAFGAEDVVCAIAGPGNAPFPSGSNQVQETLTLLFKELNALKHRVAQLEEMAGSDSHG